MVRALPMERARLTGKEKEVMEIRTGDEDERSLG
jgi:hypothetical protein